MFRLLQDIRFAFRLLAKSPGFTAIAILTLALGIGANTAIFSVVNGVLLRPLPFRDPARLVLIAEKSSFPVISTSYENFCDWRDQSSSFERMQAVRSGAITLTGAGEPERLNVQMTTAGLFSMLGINAQVGRTFLPEEDRAGGTPVVLLSYGLWQRRFGGSMEILGKPINLDTRPYTVVGVLPAGFQVFQSVDVFLPFAPWAATLPQDRNWHPGILALARLKPGVSREQANTEMIGVTKRLEQQYPLYNTGTSAGVVGLQDQIVQNSRPALLLLLGAVSFVLLIACVNVANLLLARSASRGREVAIRTALGAGRGRVIRQLLTESVMLSLAGGILGVFIAWSSIGPLLKIASGSVPQGAPIGLDTGVLAFTAAVALFTGLLFGIVPALRTAKLDLREALNEGSRSSTAGPGQHRLRGALVAMEIALALLLLVGSGLLLRSFSRLQEVPPGFQPDHLFVADIPLSLTAYAKPEDRYQFFDRLVDRARTLPGVRSAAAASFLPVSGGGSIIHFNITGHPPKSPKEFIAAGYRTITPNYLETLGVPLLQGRLFTPADNEHSPAVVVINKTMVTTFFPNENPIGKRLQLGATAEQDVPTMEIVGVVGDVLPGLGIDPQSEMYLPYRQADLLLPVFQLSVGDAHRRRSRASDGSASQRSCGDRPQSTARKSAHDGAKHGHHRGSAAFPRLAHRYLRHAGAGAFWRWSLWRDVLHRDAANQRNRRSRHDGRAAARRIPDHRWRSTATGTGRGGNWSGRRTRTGSPPAKFPVWDQRLRSLYLYWRFRSPDHRRNRGILFPSTPRNPRRSFGCPKIRINPTQPKIGVNLRSPATSIRLGSLFCRNF